LTKVAPIMTVASMATTAIIRKYTDLSALMTVAPMVVTVIPSKLNGTTVDVKTVDGYNLSDFVRPSFEANRGNKMTGGCALPYKI